MHDHQQAGCLSVRATKRSAGVGLDAKNTKHLVEGKPVGDALGVEAGDAGQSFRTGRAPEVVTRCSRRARYRPNQRRPERDRESGDAAG